MGLLVRSWLFLFKFFWSNMVEEILHCNKNIRMIPPPGGTRRKGQGGEHFVHSLSWYFTFLHAGKRFPRFTLWKKECEHWAGRDQTHILKSTDPLLYPCYLAWEQTNLNYCIRTSSDILDLEECKISAWGRDKVFRHQQGAFSFTELQFSRGELHFDYNSFCYSVI